MLDISGAGAQLPMRSHGKLRPGPQSHRNSEQQCKRIRANTASSNASATGQTQPQQTARQALQDKRPSNRSSLPRSPSCSIHLVVSCEGGGGACSAAEGAFRPHHKPPRPPPSRSPPVKRECRFLCPLGWLRLIALRPRSVGHVAAAATSAIRGRCCNQRRRPAPFPCLGVMASSSSPLAGGLVHRHCVTDSTPRGDRRPVRGGIISHPDGATSSSNMTGRARVNNDACVSGGGGSRRGAVSDIHCHIREGGSGQGCSWNRVRFDIRIGLGGGSGHRRDAVGSAQSHARGGGSGRSGVYSARRNMKGRGRGGGRRPGSGRVRRCGISGRGRDRRREVTRGARSHFRGRGSDEGRSDRCDRR